MKNLALLFFLFIFIGCDKNKTDLVLGNTDLRLQAAIAEYQQILLSNELNRGWSGILKTGSGKQFDFNFIFANNGTVDMLTDMTVQSILNSQKSLYSIKAVEKPTLVFETFNYLHILADPDPTVIGGVKGHGLRADFEFEILKYENGNLHLRGLKYQNE